MMKLHISINFVIDFVIALWNEYILFSLIDIN